MNQGKRSRFVYTGGGINIREQVPLSQPNQETTLRIRYSRLHSNHYEIQRAHHYDHVRRVDGWCGHSVQPYWPVVRHAW
ncbi:hypothetical protein AZE42_05046 [Rhizopogon vesiculosus]|uniref:Uncharacterized protein n=1 Tax=Rhizopogon vesiculosus TaxID=180088 RepID=A0A1J8Q9N8_9AGAM|nr:hypothetical protein AZE42_05046 [Rhizopogon vesiculosus]